MKRRERQRDKSQARKAGGGERGRETKARKAGGEERGREGKQDRRDKGGKENFNLFY